MELRKNCTTTHCHKGPTNVLPHKMGREVKIHKKLFMEPNKPLIIVMGKTCLQDRLFKWRDCRYRGRVVPCEFQWVYPQVYKCVVEVTGLYLFQCLLIFCGLLRWLSLVLSLVVSLYSSFMQTVAFVLNLVCCCLSCTPH